MEQSITRVSAKRSVVWAYVLLSAGLSGVACRKAAPPPPQPPPPTPIVVPRKEPPKKDVNLPAAPPIATTKAPDGKPPVSSNPPVLKPPVTKPQRRPRVARKAPAPKPLPVEETKPAAAAEAKPEAPAAQTQPAAAQPEPTTAATPPAPAAPKLGQMLKPEESREYNKRLDTTVDRVKAAVAAIQTKPLTGDQKEIVGRIRSFLAQAEQAREPDVISAVNLAERADLLSRDLLERLR